MKNNLAVIVLNYNDADNTIKYVNTINKYSIIDKIIVIDNLSPDGSFNRLKKITSNKVDVIVSDGNKGYAYGNNFAIKYLNAKYGEFKYVAISNPDVEVSEDSYNQCINFLENNKKVAIVAPRMHDINDQPHQLSGWKIRSLKGDVMDTSLTLTEFYQLPHIERYLPKYLDKDIAYVECVAGSFFIINHKIFKEVGYFDEKTFLYFEEDILGNKLKEAGYKNVVLNTCKFKHYESVTVDKNMSFMRKFKNLQKSKRYYHKTYNKHANWWKLMILDFFTCFRGIEEKTKIYKLARLYKQKCNNGLINNFLKVLILLIIIITLPVTKTLKKLRKNQKVLYFSLVTWKWIKQRPHFVALELAKSNKVDYRFQTLYDKFMPKVIDNHVNNKIEKIKNFKIKPFKIHPANNRKFINRNTRWNMIKTSFWNYDKIIITHPNQIDFFFAKVHKLKGTKFYYECMDNYEGWEQDTLGYRCKEQRLISISNHIIVSSEKLKDKLISQYNINKLNCTVVRNGYDKTLFDNYNKKEIPIKNPNIAYIGTIDDWFDFDSIISYAKNNVNVNIDIIGPIGENVKSIIKKIKEKNIKFHGPIEHDLVPYYIEKSDVLIVPFIINDIIEYVDPVKIYEYLYMKKPVVTTYWNELKQFNNMVYFYEGSKDFEKKVNEAFNSKFKITKEYNKIIKESNWSERLKEYVKIVK